MSVRETSHQPTADGSAELAALRAEVQLLRDKEAIVEHTVAYNHAWDDGRGEDWVATFTADGEFAMPEQPEVVGESALREMTRDQLSRGFVHITTDHHITVDGDTAQQTCTLILSKRSPGKEAGSSVWVTAGRYSDTLRRTPEGWRFARRWFVPDAWWD
ncbi:nuclear transport factor 2 family protein [Amycolatopsis pithecellobii]|uniref:DUF4440 domain-containing protein n=1 Tax=Amycolatopsis pithecellobii TaxID=664692 RepID=A0A6N7Z2Z3_9PSEU|nr:nuclear transport factor 2 family protein [Amycolatopsis pithecellobii]MTD53176.1 DUF4440 domain-containing protein [Amycolatopsis pithecellobii]